MYSAVAMNVCKICLWVKKFTSFLEFPSKANSFDSLEDGD